MAFSSGVDRRVLEFKKTLRDPSPPVLASASPRHPVPVWYGRHSPAEPSPWPSAARPSVPALAGHGTCGRAFTRARAGAK